VLVDLFEPYFDSVFPDLVTACYSACHVVKERVEDVGKMLRRRRQLIRRVLEQLRRREESPRWICLSSPLVEKET
jgi:hypothetical protein